jgi:hypothetical protein
MVKRRALLALFIVLGLAASTGSASAATPAAKTPFIFDRATSAVDGSITSIILYLRDRVTLAYRALRNKGIDPTSGTGYNLDGIADGPEGGDPLGAKGSGLHGATPAQTRLPG